MSTEENDPTLLERLSDMAEEKGLPDSMRDTAREAIEYVELHNAPNKLMPKLRDLLHELEGMALEGRSWPDQLEFVRVTLGRIVKLPPQFEVETK